MGFKSSGVLDVGGRSEGDGVFDEWVEKLGLKGILDLPSIALSNGQTMRTRIAQTAMKAPEGLLLDKPSGELLLPFVSCVFLPPFVVHFIPSRNSFLPFPRSSLRFSLSSTCYPFVHLSSRCVHFSRILVPISSLKFFLAFPLSRSISRSPSLTSPPSSLLPHFATFGVFNPHTNTPFLPHLTNLAQPPACTSSAS